MYSSMHKDRPMGWFLPCLVAKHKPKPTSNLLSNSLFQDILCGLYKLVRKYILFSRGEHLLLIFLMFVVFICFFCYFIITDTVLILDWEQPRFCCKMGGYINVLKSGQKANFSAVNCTAFCMFIFALDF